MPLDLSAYENALKKLNPRLVMPVSGGRVSQDVGADHIAIDFALPTGAPVVSPYRGIVTSIADLTTGYGRHVRIKTPEGNTLIFGHLDSIGVKVGQPVSAGFQIGTVGNTGNSTGSHLHFEVRETEWKPIDPWAFLKGAAQPNIDTLEYSVNKNTPLPTPARIKPPAMKVDSGSLLGAPVSGVGFRSVPAPTSLNLDSFTMNATAENQPTENKGLPAQFIDALTDPFERSAIFILGIILMVVGLWMFSSRLREAATYVVKDIVAPAVATAAGSPAAGAAVSAIL